MPNPQQYSGYGSGFPHNHDAFTGNAQPSSYPHQLPYPVGLSQQKQTHEPQSFPQSHLPAPYTHPASAGYAHQPSQMPAAPDNQRYAHRAEVPPAQCQPQFPQARHPGSYPQYGFAAGTVQQEYAVGSSGGYAQPGSVVGNNPGYVNGAYPPLEIHSGHSPYPLQMHNSGHGHLSTRGPSTADVHAADRQSQSSHSTDTVPQAKPALRLPRISDQHPSGNCEPTSSAGSKVVNQRQSSESHNSAHIVKPAVLHSGATGKSSHFLCNNQGFDFYGISGNLGIQLRSEK